MALIICPECNDARISDKAPQCPKCGCSMGAILKIIDKKEQCLQEEMKSLNDYIFDCAEYEWKSYCDGMADAADEYNKKYAELEGDYRTEISSLESEATNLLTKTKKTDEDISRLYDEISSIGFSKNKKRKTLAKEIRDISAAIKDENDDLQNRISEIKSRFDNELSEYEKKLFATKNEQMEIIRKRENIRYLDCESLESVALCLTRDSSFRGYWLRKIIGAKGAMTKDEIVQLAYAFFKDNRRLQLALTHGLKDLLNDDDFLYLHDIEIKQFGDDLYYVPLSESTKRDMLQQTKEKNKQLEQKIADLQMDYLKSFTEGQHKKSASVIKRGVAGAVIAGPAGAILGGMSAIDKNLNDK